MEDSEQLHNLIKQIVRESLAQLTGGSIAKLPHPKDDVKPVKLLEYYDRWIVDFEKQVAAGQKAESTLRKHKTVYFHLKNFIKQKYNKDDILIQEARHDFPIDFNLYLKKEGVTLNSRCVYLGSMQMIFRLATHDGIIDENPCRDFHITMEEKDRGFLTKEELKRLWDYKCEEGSNEELIRDLFLFCCYTGLSYIDLVKLSREDIVTNPLDSRLWIMTHRKKTGVKETVRLFPEVAALLKKHLQAPIYNNVFSVPNPRTCNRTIKRIAEKCGINKKVSWHIARHTMATTICLANGMPIEAVAKILGHKKIKTTQIYAKITQDTLGRELNKLEDLLSLK